MFATAVFDFLIDFAYDPCAVLGATSIFIFSEIPSRGKKRIETVVVSGIDFNTIKACFL